MTKTESMAAKKRRAADIVTLLEGLYPEALCSLRYDKDYELLFAVRLSAQCTDARVNIVTKSLYARYPTLESLAEANLADLEELVRPCGFFRVKARDIQETASLLLTRHGSRVPQDMDALLALPGVGRKTANLIRGDLFGLSAIVTDTHCIRIAGRLGLVDSKQPEMVERQLAVLIAPDKSNDFCHRLVLFGREFCTARSPRCTGCGLLQVCPHAAPSEAR